LTALPHLNKNRTYQRRDRGSKVQISLKDWARKLTWFQSPEKGKKLGHSYYDMEDLVRVPLRTWRTQKGGKFGKHKQQLFPVKS